ncbi:MAG: IclR family transcriptional regulator [Vicinamibacteraceae bacterium]
MDQYRIPSLARACEILELFVETDTPLSSSEVARRVHVPRTTALRILMTLCEQGLLSRSGNDFEAGGALFRLGIRALSSQRLRRFAAPIMQRLAAEVRETTQLVTLSGNDGLILEVVEGPRLLRIALGAGTIIDLHCNAAGKVLLTFALRARLPALVAQGLPVRTPNTLTTLPDLEAETSRIQTLGYAVDDEECYEGVRCLSAPVWDASGGTRAALGVIASASTFTRRQNADVAQHVVAAARELSAAMGYDERTPHD